MTKRNLIYCYDAYCGWCYAFNPILSKIAVAFNEVLTIEVLSGGMVIPSQPLPFKETADSLIKATKRVEEISGIHFGKAYYDKLNKADEDNWSPNSLQPSMALSILKEQWPNKALEFAHAIQTCLYAEGKDLTKIETYLPLLNSFQLDESDFVDKMNREEYEDKARYDFALVKQLKVEGFPRVFIQANNQQFYMAAKGYTDYQTLKNRIENILDAIENH